MKAQLESSDFDDILKKGEKQDLVLEFKKIQEAIVDQKQLLTELEYMKGVYSIEEYKETIKTRHFWGDMQAIQRLERELNVKLLSLIHI